MDATLSQAQPLVARELLSHLIKIIEVEYGLVDELIQMNLVDKDKIQDIKSRQAKIEFLLENVNQEQMLLALEKTTQLHVANYIRAHGKRAPEYGDDWPVRCVREGLKQLTEHKMKLIDFIDNKCGLLDEMLARGCIGQREKERIEKQETSSETNRQLLDIVHRKSVADYQKFIDCLKRTKNDSAVSILGQSETQSVHPLSDANKSLLNKWRPTLITIIEPRNSLLPDLTCRQKEFVESATSDADRNKRMLDIIQKTTEENFVKFVEWFRKCDQQHVANILQGKAVPAQIVAKTSSDNDNDDESIVEKFLQFFRQSSDDTKKNVYRRVTQEIEHLRIKGVEVAHLATHKSVELTLVLTSPSGFHFLLRQYYSGELKSTVTKMFKSLLGDSNKTYHVDYNLSWDAQNFALCAEQVYREAGCQLLAKVYELSMLGTSQLTNVGVTEICNEGFSFELIEIVLLRTAVELFSVINTISPYRAESYTVANLSAVSKLWWYAMTYRELNKEKLKRNFARFRHPYKTTVKHLQTVHLPTNRSAMGVAEFQGKLYVVSGSKTVHVYSSSRPFEQLKSLKVPDLKSPDDIVACAKTAQLFIADDVQRCVWRLKLVDEIPADKFVDGIAWQPFSLSCTSGRLTVVPYRGDAIYQYSEDGKMLRSVGLPGYMWALHAVETAVVGRNAFVVAHRKASIDDADPEHADSVSEISFGGQILRRFSAGLVGFLNVDVPHYVAVDANNRNVLVADRRNERIIVLTPDLKLSRVLIAALKEQPKRIVFMKDSGLLVVAFVYSSDIRAYECYTSLM